MNSFHRPCKEPTRESYGKALAGMGRKYPDIVVLDADLSSATKTEYFTGQFPERFFECGIQEANMMDAAAGMASFGLVPFVSTFAMFAAGRAYEMIRNSIAYPNLNVKICATHGGISVGQDGASHQCCEDFALMRSIPNMTVLCPADSIEAEKMLEAAYHHDGPVYIRFGREAAPVFHDPDMHYQIGKAECLKDGTDIAILGCGMLVYPALQAARRLEEQGISAMVLNMASIKPLDEQAVIQAAQKTGCLLVCEEHSILGGLGEAVAGIASKHCPVLADRVGMEDVFGCSGKASELLHYYGLDADGIFKKSLELLAKKHWLCFFQL